MPEVELVERVEGHVGLEIDFESKKDEKIKFGIKEGPRLFEGFLQGRTYDEIPFFASRICGFCPIVHNLSAIKALENALGISPPEIVSEFRRALNLMEFVQSHSAHLYVLTLPDFAGGKDDLFSLKSEFPEKVKEAVKLRKDVNAMIETLGGRTVHPLTPRVGGFSKLPSKEEMEKGLERLERMKPRAEETVDLIAGLDFPDFAADTHYLALGRDDDRYPTYDGRVISSDGLDFETENYSDFIDEETKSYSTAKFSTIDGKAYLTGALSRINLNGDKLNGRAADKMEEIGIDFPSENPFHNNVAQAIETLHGVEEIENIYEKLLTEDFGGLELKGRDLKDEDDFDLEPGSGSDAVEAPRGTLFHYYELDEEGLAEDVDILTPTAQSAANIERDINLYFSEIAEGSEEEVREKIKTLVRAYDPCISCSVH